MMHAQRLNLRWCAAAVLNALGIACDEDQHIASEVFPDSQDRLSNQGSYSIYIYSSKAQSLLAVRTCHDVLLASGTESLSCVLGRSDNELCNASWVVCFQVRVCTSMACYRFFMKFPRSFFQRANQHGFVGKHALASMLVLLLPASTS